MSIPYWLRALPRPGGDTPVFSPSIAALADGGTAVAYIRKSDEGNWQTAQVDVYDAFGRLETRLERLQGAVVTEVRDVELFGLADGGFGFLNEWRSAFSTGNQAVILDVLDEDGQSFRHPDNVNRRLSGGGVSIPNGAGSDVEGAAALGEDGRTLMATWYAYSSLGYYSGSRAQIHDVSDPDLSIEVSLDADVLGAIFTPTDVAALAGGGWIVGGLANSTPLRRNGPAHVRISSEGEVSALTWDVTATGNDSGPQVVGLAGGGWASINIFRGLTDDGFRILMDVYDAEGARVRDDAFVADIGGEWPSPQRPDASDALDAVALKDGGFLVAFLSDDKQRVLLQRFDAQGDAVGGRMTLGKDPVYDMHAPRLALLDDGRVAFSYLDRGATFVYGEAHAGILDPRGETILGGDAAEVLMARRAGGVLRGEGGDDVILGLGAKDVLRGGRGDDGVSGGGARDRIFGEQGDDRLHGDGGGDRISGAGGKDALFGGGGRDRLDGGGGRDRLDGGGGGDALSGGGGSDVLTGGGGDDRMAGGKGADRFLFKPGDGLRDVIVDFGGRDKIGFLRGVDGLRELKIRDRGDDVHVVYDGGKVILKEVEPGEIRANDFLFG